MTNILQRSLKIRVFVMFFLMAVLAVSILGAITFFAGKSIIQKQVEAALVSTSQNKEMTMVGLMSKDKVAFNLIQEDRWLTETVEKILNNDPGSRQLTAEVCAHLKDFLKSIPNANEIFVMDMKGKVMLSSEEAHVGEDKADDTFFTDGLKGLHFKSVYHSKSTNQISWGISGPFLSSDKKSEMGVVALRFSAAGLQKVLSERAGLGETGESYLVDRNGIMVSESRFNADAMLRQKVDTEPVRLFQQSGKGMAGVYKDYRNQSVLGASMGDDLTKEADMGWVILSEMDATEAFAPINQLGITIIILGLIISLVVGFAAFLIAQGIANPISAIAQIAKKVGEGDLTQNVAETNAQDEIGNLAAGFRNMIAGLRTILLKVQEATGQITASGTEILAASQEQASAAREQSSAVAETTSAAKELSTTSESVGESIKKVAQVASHAMAGMAKIKESIDKTNGMLNSLGEKSQKIGKITDLIDDVADQTNLLAVNASIEAARAGEQGRGFTVVADEIRKLADSTAKSTKDITSLIELIQHEMSNAIMSMEQSIQSVDEEARLAQQTTEKTKEIAMSTHQQISGAKQIAEAMMNIDETMKQVAAGAQQSQVAVKQLTSLAGELNHLAAKFKL